MNDPVGLCRGCLHHKPVGNRRGTRFYLCRRSTDDPSYPKYPRLPVLKCAGYEEGPEDPWLRFLKERGGGEPDSTAERRSESDQMESTQSEQDKEEQ